MKSTTYDTYYKTENLFGNAYPELLSFFSELPKKGNVLDIGCGQGRNAIPLAKMGFNVTGIDNSALGIEQMMALKEPNIKGKVADIYQLNDFASYDIILLDSMFHFAKKDKKKETDFIKKILLSTCLIVFCIQDKTQKIAVLNETIGTEHKKIVDKKFTYVFESDGHYSKTDYRMIVVKTFTN